MNYDEALAWLYGTQARGIKLGLDRVRDFLDSIGWRQGKQRFVHVAGTNGKGSVCAMVEAVCRAAGMRTGLFTSPHLITFRERIRVNGEMIGKEEIAGELTRIRGICEGAGIEPTFFEITTALALMIFQRAAPDVVVLETGLGGRLDSTNVVRPAVVVITSIGLDHTQMLGETLGEIAGEKAGIIKEGVPVVTGVLPEEAREVVAWVAGQRNARVSVVAEMVENCEVGLKGVHQRGNAAVALRAIAEAGMEVSSDAAREGLKSVSWPGRFQDTGRFILDGAHNPQAARTLVETWREVYGERRTDVILGVVKDKDARGICAELAEIAENFLVVPVRGPRGGGTDDVARIAGELRPVREYGSFEEAINTAGTGKVPRLITGSLFLIGEALVALGLAEEEQEISSQ